MGEKINKKGSKKSSSTAKHTENYKNQPASEKDIRKELEAIKINFTEDEIDFTLNEIIEKISNNKYYSFLKNLGLAGGFLFIVTNGTKDWAVDREKKYVRL